MQMKGKQRVTRRVERRSSISVISTVAIISRFTFSLLIGVDGDVNDEKPEQQLDHVSLLIYGV